MKFINITDKQAYLLENYPFRPVPKLTDQKFCIHCFKQITVGDFKVQQIRRSQLIVCPNAPECDGTLIDWFERKPF